MKQHMPLVMVAAAAIVLIVLGSIVQGLLTGRWGSGSSEELDRLAAAFENIPLEIGDWEGEKLPIQNSEYTIDVVDDSSITDPVLEVRSNLEDKVLFEGPLSGLKEAYPAAARLYDQNRLEMKAAGAVGSFSARYANSSTGRTVTVRLICGMSRDVAIHTPEACYPGAGFESQGETEDIAIDGSDWKSNFFTTVFRKTERVGVQRLRVFWAWNVGATEAAPNGAWEAPKYPRLIYGPRKPLNKLYVISETPESEQADDNAAHDFAKVFLPKVSDALFPKTAPKDSESEAEAATK
ncbi:MAG: hypothetical protein HQ581_28050 [Planctomycetes bacterium]|nr:hypothetical protein [Planctomycetota bacterium]